MKPYKQLLYQLAAERGQAVHYQRFPIRDVDAPTPDTLEAVLEALAVTTAAGGKAAVHCWGGFCRSGIIIGCYLVRHHELSGPQALAHIAQQWQQVAKSHCKLHSPEPTAQYHLVEGFN